MKRKPTATEWERYAELLRNSIVADDDDPQFILGVCRRYDPKKNGSLAAFFRWCRSRSPDHWYPSSADTVPDKESRVYVDTSPGIVESALDAELVRETVGQAGYAVLRLRHGEGLSVTQTAKRLGLSRESVVFIEKEAMRRASSIDGGD